MPFYFFSLSRFIAPLEAGILIVWWAVDTIGGDTPEMPWYGFSPESFMATVFEVS